MRELVKLCFFSPLAFAGLWAIFNRGQAAALVNKLSDRLRSEFPNDFLVLQSVDPLHKPEVDEASQALLYGVQFAGALLALFAFSRLFN